MRVVAVFAGLIAISGLSAAGQYAPPPTTTLSNGVAGGCFTTVQPMDSKHGKGSTVTECKTVVVEPTCPVDMRVRQRMGGSMVAVDENGVKRRIFAQRLRLFLNDQRSGKADQKIVSATVTVHGTTDKERIQRLDQRIDPWDLKSADKVRTFTVDLANWGGPGVTGDFQLPGFTSSRRVDLESVVYEDGSTWKLSGNETCHVAPDLLMPVEH